MRLLIFLLIEVVMFPLQLLARVAFMIKLILNNRSQGISRTAYEPLFIRLFLHAAGVRSDEAAYRLARHLPAMLTPVSGDTRKTWTFLSARRT